MSRFIALGAVLALLAAGASAKTLKITKSEAIQHPPPEAVQHPPATVEPLQHRLFETKSRPSKGAADRGQRGEAAGAIAEALIQSTSCRRCI